MMFVIGIVLFALAILISVALHECGHMWAARATGMKVRRYFVGFGPTLWSTRRGETEYGIKGIPAGGFCDIAGMTPAEDLAPDEQDRAMFKQKTWKRVAVLFAGPGMNFVICLVLMYVIAVIWGLPNLHPSDKAIVGVTGCVAADIDKNKQGPCEGQGLRRWPGSGPATWWSRSVTPRCPPSRSRAAAVRTLHGTVPVVVERDGRQVTTNVTIQQTQRYDPTAKDKDHLATVGAIGVGPPRNEPTRYNVLTAIPGTVVFAGQPTVEVGKSLAAIPTKVGALVNAIGGGERDKDTPMSVVGASIVGGDTVNHGLWVAFWFFLAQSTWCWARSTCCRCCRSTAATSRSRCTRRSATRSGRRGARWPPPRWTTTS